MLAKDLAIVVHFDAEKLSFRQSSEAEETNVECRFSVELVN